MSNSRLEFEDVDFAFGSRPVLSGVSFELTAGKIAALTGPNGSGKTTLLKLAAGRLRARRGQVTSTGDVCYVPTRLDFHERLTVDEEVRYLSSVGLLALSDLNASLEEWELGEQRATEIGDLSTGQRQRLALAIASSWNPKIVLLDEPTANVDRRGRALIGNWIDALCALGGVVVVATHDLGIDFLDRYPQLQTIALGQ